jgi:hypothetical protein
VSRKRNAYILYGITLAVVLLEELIGWLGGPWQTISETVWDLGAWHPVLIVPIVASLSILAFHFALPHWPGRQYDE